MGQKTLVACAILACALAVGATPASAQFERTAETTKVEPLAKAPSELTLKVGEGTVTCKSTVTKAIDGDWWFGTKAQRNEQYEISPGVFVTLINSQMQVRRGPHLLILLQTIGACTLSLGESKLEATPKWCLLTTIQEAKEGATKGVGTATFSSECEIKASVCTLKIPATKVNEGLKTVNLVKGGTEQVEAKFEVTGITVNATAGCVGISGTNSKGEFRTSAPMGLGGAGLI